MKNKNIVFWIFTSLLVLVEGVIPLGTLIFSPEDFNLGTKPLGYPDYFAYTLIIAKILGVIAIIVPGIPKTLKEWAYAGLAFNLIFAFISHLVVDQNIGFLVMPVVVFIILMISYVKNPNLKKV